jgi:integral membrane sensor domain MASE1
VLYFSCASLAIIKFGTNTPIWFSGALATVWLLRHEMRRWPALLAAVYVSDTLAIQLFGSGPAALLAIADVMETAAAVLILRIGGPAAALSSPAGMGKLLLICGGCRS